MVESIYKTKNMKDTIAFQVAEFADIEGVLTLQEKYLVGNLNEEEKKSGFVTTPFTVAQLQMVIAKNELFLVKDTGVVVGYIFSGSWSFFEQWPIFVYMTGLFKDLQFENFEITTENSFQYGPVCIDKAYRGKGLINKLFELMRIHLLKKYPLSLTFINKNNIPSQRAHTEKLKWTIIGDFEFNNNQYFILAYNMAKSCLTAL
jgi:hypothetical protein